MFKDCLANGKVDDDDGDTTRQQEAAPEKKLQQDKPKKNSEKQAVRIAIGVINLKNLVVLSPSIIKATAGYMSEFVAKAIVILSIFDSLE